MSKVFEKDCFHLLNGKKLTITFLGHASVVLDYDNTIIYLDPISSECDFNFEPKADIILVTHSHDDHFDKKAINILKTEQTKIIANQEVIDLLDFGKALKNGQHTKIKDIEIKATSAYNTTIGRDCFHPKDRDNGYLICLDSFRIYFSGDTEIVNNIDELKNVDIAFLAVNQPYTMTIEQANHFIREISPRIFYPYHLTDTNIEELKEKLKDTSIDCRIRKMQ
jgi:L-ascorbate metabolism protein UlaG (beta-lactamase superfamily)